MSNRIQQLAQYGQSPWYDNIHRSMLDGELGRLIQEDGLKGVTSNPTIFEKAIAGSDDYDQAIADIIRAQSGLSNEQIFFSLAVEDIRRACDAFKQVYEDSDGVDGMVSLEVSPDLAYDTGATVEQALELFKRIDRPNAMIKVPATKEGVPAVEALIAEGLNINVTLLFSVQRYREVVDAYLAGLRYREKAGRPLNRIASVASFFVSRVDAAVDARIDEKLKQGSEGVLKTLRGKIAVANAKAAYEVFENIFLGAKFENLAKAGAKPQRLLWASTGTKNPEYSDVMYLDSLIGSNTVNTIPPKTYKAFLDHGQPRNSLKENFAEDIALLANLADSGISLDGITEELERKGVKSFADSFKSLLESIGREVQAVKDKVG